MANAVEKVNGIAIASIEAINGKTDSNIQALNGLEFVSDDPAISAMIQSDSGGSSTGDGAGTIDATNYKWIRFESSGYLNVTDPGNVTILVVAGGGGGGMVWAGGGGGGGLLYTASIALTTGVHTVTVGAGGAVGTDGDHDAERGSNGGNSVFDSTGVSLTGGAVALGGGGGGPTFGYNGVGESSGGDGGSGGGAGRYARYISGATDYQSPQATGDQGDDGGLTGFGEDGGYTTVNNGFIRGHGGGGAGAEGHEQTGFYNSYTTTQYGDGGAGKNYSITGSAVGYAGGGGGCTNPGDAAGYVTESTVIATGSHGGGSGAGYKWSGSSGQNAVAGTANTGGGGGAGASAGYASATDFGAAGGSGVVIVRYKFQ